jgi:5S rRNA maturation endonuclease (ribonuclease M5)
MNCKKANENISIREILESFSLFPSKDNQRNAFYYAFDREEKTPSLSVNYEKNTAFDFGTAKKYNNVSLVQGIKKCSVSEALQYLKRFDFSVSITKTETTDRSNLNPNRSANYRILDIKEVENHSLIQYLKTRKVENQTEFLKEIHYQMNDKNYYGIGFKNDSDGYEIRNKYSKICLGKKDISTIKNSSENVKIFEGFFDFLSFKNVENFLEKEPSDYIILNSVSMISNIKNSLRNYENIELYFDNDEAGNRALEMLKNELENIEDCRVLYSDFKDLNEWAMSSTKLEEKLGGSLVQKVPKVYNKRDR